MIRDQINITVIQPAIKVGDLEGNFSAIRRLLDAAVQASQLDLVILPENFMLWGPRQGKEQDPQPVLDFLRSIAVEYGIYLVGGSLHRRHPDGRILNTCYIYERSGEILGEYHKRQLFYRELNMGIARGSKDLVVDIEGWKVGILICADLWYPELCRNLMDNAHIIAVPAQSVVRNKTYQAYACQLWRALALTRSQENGMVVAIADHPEGEMFPYAGGGSSICDPSAGSIEEEIGNIQLVIQDGMPGFLTATMDKRRLEQFREYRRERGLLPLNNRQNFEHSG